MLLTCIILSWLINLLALTRKMTIVSGVGDGDEEEKIWFMLFIQAAV